MADGYPIPTSRAKTELIINRSRFISTADYAPTIEAAKSLISEIKETYPDASHHVYAFAVGYGASVTHGMTDDGEPKSTAGKPTLAVVRGSGLGDVVVVTTRYFGGTKLGTGGLVKAYTESAQLVLAEIGRGEKIAKQTLTFTTAYHFYEPITRLAPEYDGEITSQSFSTDVALTLVLPESQVKPFAAALTEMSAGRIKLDLSEAA